MEVKHNIDYSKYSLTELIDIYSRVDRRYNEDRALTIEAEITKRTGMDREAIENEIKKGLKSKAFSAPRKNTVIKVIAWILIIYSGFRLLGALFSFVAPSPYDLISIDAIMDTLPDVSKFLFNNLYIMEMPSLIIAGLFIFFSIGLLNIEESARENTVYMLWFALFWNIGWTIFMHKYVTLPMMGNFASMMDAPNEGFFQSFSYVSLIFSQLIPTIIIGFFIYKLSSYEVKRIFRAAEETED